MSYQPRTLPGSFLDGPRYVNVTDEALTLQELLYAEQTQWVTDTVTVLGAVVVPTVDNGHCYICTARDGDFKTGAQEPTWPLKVGETVVDDKVTWTCTLVGMLNPGLKVLTLIPEGEVLWAQGDADADSPVLPESGVEIECSSVEIQLRTFFSAEAAKMQVLQGG